MKRVPNFPRVYIYCHPDGKQYLFSPALLKTEVKYIELFGFTDESLNELFAEEKNAEGWFCGESVTRFMNGLYEQAAKENIGNELAETLLQNGITTLTR